MLNYKDFYKNSQKDGLENTLRLFYSSYYGIVVDNKDPQKQGRIKVKVPQITGSQVINIWALPKSYAGTDSGFFAVPEIGDGVWVEFELGNPRFPVYSGGWWSKPDGQESEIPEEARGDDYPNVRIWKEKSGYLLFNNVTKVLKWQNTDGPFVEMSDNLVKLYGDSQPAVLGDDNASVHQDHISQLQDVISQLNILIAQLNTTFTAQGTAFPPLAPAATAFATATAPITVQLNTINTQLTAIKTNDVPQTLSGKVKLD